MKILVIEDNPVNMKLVTVLLERSGHEIFQAESAAKGIELARQELPALIMMDIQMPGMDGLAATRILKGDQRTKDIKIVALTAFAMCGDKERILAAGCDSYLTKPINQVELETTINSFAGETQGAGAGLVAAVQQDEAVQSQIDIDSIKAYFRKAYQLSDQEIDMILIEGVRSFADLLANCEEAFARQDMTALGWQAHTVKGVLLNMGLTHQAELARNIEDQATRPGVGRSFLENQFQQLRGVLAALKENAD